MFEEVAYLAYYLHWDADSLLDMPHGERRTWCEQVSGINSKIMKESASTPLR